MTQPKQLCPESVKLQKSVYKAAICALYCPTKVKLINKELSTIIASHGWLQQTCNKMW